MSEKLDCQKEIYDDKVHEKPFQHGDLVWHKLGVGAGETHQPYKQRWREVRWLKFKIYILTFTFSKHFFLHRFSDPTFREWYRKVWGWLLHTNWNFGRTNMLQKRDMTKLICNQLHFTHLYIGQYIWLNNSNLLIRQIARTGLTYIRGHNGYYITACSWNIFWVK